MYEHITLHMSEHNDQKMSEHIVSHYKQYVSFSSPLP
jgi:hypothetical protein